MNLPNLKRMTAEDYALWAARQDTGRFELIDGIIVQMNAERLAHVRVKTRVSKALERALAKTNVVGEVLWDGMALRIGEKTVHEPDAMLRVGATLPDDTIFVSDPLVVVEVLSPSTGPVDTGLKLTNYFKLDTVQHYLVINTVQRVVQHYVRDATGTPIMRPLVTDGEISLEPPGLTLSLEEIFDA